MLSIFPIIIDIVLLFLLLLFIISGYKRGLILGISGIIIIIIAFLGAGKIAGTYSDRFKPMIEPLVVKLVNKSVTETEEQYKTSPSQTAASGSELDTVGLESLLNLGIFKDTAENIITDLKKSVTKVGQEFKSAVASRLTSSVSYILTFIASYIVITIILTLALRLLNFVFRAPGLGLINGAGGMVLGAAKGMLILFAIAWAMRYFGGVFPDETLSKTVFLKWLMGNNLLTAFLGI